MNSAAIQTARQRGHLAPLKFEHAGLRTPQLDTMIAWYTTVLQADVGFRSERIAFLWYDEQNHRLALIARPGTVPRHANSAGLDHLAFSYAAMHELAETYARLKGEGILPARATDHGSSTSLYYQDPDGNEVELKVDRFSTAEEQHAWLRSEAFARNPIGEPFDPEALLTHGALNPST